MLLLSLTSLAFATQIPTQSFAGDPDRGWKRGLYDVLVSLDNPVNFDLGYPLPLIVGPTTIYGFPSNTTITPAGKDEFLQNWLMEGDAAPVVDYMWAPPETYTLTYIEGGTMWPSHLVNTSLSLVQPLTQEERTGYAFLYHWDYSGNPYQGRPEVLARAMSVLALELIGIDQAHKVENNTDPDNHVFGTPITATEPGCSAQPPRASNLYGNGLNTSYDFALTLEDLAYSYWMIRDDVPDWTRSYYDEAFMRLGDRLACWGPLVLHFNRTTPGALALLLIADATGSPDAFDDYETYTGDMLSFFDKGGFFPDDWGWDSSYNNINIGNMGRLAEMDDRLGPSVWNHDIHATLEEMYRMKRHVTISEPFAGPEHFRYAPNHWNTRTGADTVSGQGLRSVSSFEGISMRVADAYSELRDWDPNSPIDFAYMGTTTPLNGFSAAYRSAFAFGSLDPQFTANDNWNASPYPLVRAWTEQAANYYWPNYAVTEWDHSRDYLADWANDIATNPDLELFSNELSGDTCEEIDDDFVFVRANRLSALVYTGPVSFYEDGQTPLPQNAYMAAGYGGGMLSYLYDTDSGATILSRRRTRYPSTGTAADLEVAENWDRWDSWALHDVWVHRAVPGGESLTHSARILTPTVKVAGCTAGSGTASVTVSGKIPATNSTPWLTCTSGQLGCVDFTAPIPYSRTFGFSSNGPIKIVTEVGPTADIVDAVVETIPLNGLSYLNYGDTTGWTPTSNWHWEDAFPIEFDTLNGPVVASQNVNTWVDDVTSVTYPRLGHGIRINFMRPQRVKLNDFYGFWYNFDVNAQTDGDGSNTWLRTHNLVVDVLANALGPNYVPQVMPATTIAYTIERL